MSIDDTNPYEPTATDPKPPAAARGAMEYMQSYHYLFETEKWMANILWSGLCLLTAQVIPFVGQMVLVGYMFEIVEVLLCNPTRKGYPDFDPNRIIDYLKRGVWVVVVQFVLALGFGLVIMIFMAVGFGVVLAIGAATDGDEAGMTIGLIVVVAIGSALMFVLSIVMILIMTPVTIRAGLTQEFGAAFDMPWIKDFVRKMWIEILLSTVFLIAMAMIAEVLGLLACLVGIFPAIAAVMLMQGHLYLQMYQLYLARGGESIPLKPTNPLQSPKPA